MLISLIIMHINKNVQSHPGQDLGGSWSPGAPIKKSPPGRS